jgi:hypothetical protein
VAVWRIGAAEAVPFNTRCGRLHPQQKKAAFAAFPALKKGVPML